MPMRGRGVTGLVLWALVPLQIATTHASAQTPTVAWELAGDAQGEMANEGTKGLAFLTGITQDGSLDTLYAANYSGVFRLDPDASEWSLLCELSRCRAEFIVVTKEGSLIIGSRAGTTSDGVRSIDGGATWERDIIGVGVSTFLQSTLSALGGAVYAGNASSLGWSYDGGEPGTWVFGDPLGGEPIDLVEVQPSVSLPDGRLVGGVWNGAVYSDDGAETWTPSALFGVGHLIVNSLTFAADTSHAYAGVLYAGVHDANIDYPALYRSDDGGVNWDFVRAFEPDEYGLPDPEWAVVKAGNDSTLFVGLEDLPGGADPSSGVVVASFDSGDTWEQIADSTNGWGGYGVQEFVLARDGRLYAGTDLGVWRTVDPIVVSNEAPERGTPDFGMSIEVAPNPVRNHGTVTLTVGVPASIRVSVYDTLGREVALITDEYLTRGRHSLALNTTGLSSGVYFLSAVASAHGTSTQYRSVTVVN